jgi:hypothetical protein
MGVQTTFIYYLQDPRNPMKGYIGKSNDPNDRLLHHYCESKGTYKYKWLRKLARLGLKPAIVILEEVSYDCWQEKEIYWIAFYRWLGYTLTNSTDGGEGVTPSEETCVKISQSLKGKVQSEKTRLKRSRSMMGKASAWMKGRPSPFKDVALSETHRYNISESLKKTLSERIEPHWNVGRGHPAWNRGQPSKYRGVPRPKEVVDKMIKTRKQRGGWIVSEESRRKNGESHMGKTPSQETLEKRRNTNFERYDGVWNKGERGRKHTEERRIKTQQTWARKVAEGYVSPTKGKPSKKRGIKVVDYLVQNSMRGKGK